MTEHYFEHPMARIHYYRFGSGEQTMLCFHGYGMHGKQFKLLEPLLGHKYTFYGFDLFFHKETKLQDQSLQTVRAGITKEQLCEIMEAFCKRENIDRFSVIGYSMGTHYATVMAERLSHRINEYIVIAPSCLKPGVMLRFLATTKVGNYAFRKLILSENGLLSLLTLCRRIGVIDDKGHEILKKEFATPELRFDFYASATYLRAFRTDGQRLIGSLNQQPVKSLFIFGKRDKMYPPGIGKHLIAKVKNAKTVILDENHEMINRNFAITLSQLLQ